MNDVGRGFDRVDTAVVFIDPQNDVLSENGAAWNRQARRLAQSG